MHDLRLFAKYLKELLEHTNREYFWYQRKTIEDFFIHGKKEVFLDIPRKSGKTELEIDFLVLKAMLVPKGRFYFVSFTEDNGRETVWERLKAQIPPNWLEHSPFKETTLEVAFKNGSTLVIKGSNMNVNALRGTQPDSVVFDEFRDHKQAFHDAMGPNCFKAHCQILYGSTPPDLLDVEEGKCQFYVNQAKKCQEKENSSYYNFTCWEGNPLPDVQAHYKDAFEDAQRTGRMAEFEREYLAKLVKGSQDSLFPEFGDDDLIPHQDIIGMVRHIKRPIYVVGNDTSGQKRYGHLFAVIDRDLKDLYIIDAITRRSYSDNRMDRERAKMTGQLLWPDLVDKFKELNPGSVHKDWCIVWDCQDTPIIDDIHRWHGDDIRIRKVNKKKMLKEHSYGLIRDLKTMNKIKIGTRAAEFIDEAKCYHLMAGKENAKKTYDELIDCLRYILYEFDHWFNTEALKQPTAKTIDAEREFYQDIESFARKQDSRLLMPEYFIEDDYL